MKSDQDFHDFEKLFWLLSKQMEYEWKEIYTKTFPGSQSGIMYLLEQKGPQKMSDIASALHITAGAITTASSILIENGDVTRLRNEQDRRVIYLDLTEQGKLKLNELQNEGHQVMKHVFGHLTDTDLEKINQLFKQASINLNLRTF